MAAIGALVGFLIGLTGLGGGSMLTPTLVLSGMPVTTAVGTSLAYAFLTKVSGSISFWRSGLVHMDIVRDLSYGCFPGTLTGAFVIRYLGLRQPEVQTKLMTVALGVVLIAVSLIMLARLLPLHLRPRVVDRTLPFRSWQRRAVIVLVGFGVGMIVTVTSIGSGAALIPAMVLFYRLDSGTLVGTNVFMGVILAAIAALPHIGLGNVSWEGVVALICGSIPSVWVASRLHGRIPKYIPEGIIGLALLAMGVGILLKRG
jgi:hypothetical protein